MTTASNSHAILNDRKYSRVRTLIAAGALAAAALSMAGGIAQAKDSETTIKNDCTSEVDGTYTTTTVDGVTTSKCCYEGMFGVTHCDVFVDGVYDEGQSFLEAEPAGPTKPIVTRPIPPGVLSPVKVDPAPSKGPLLPNVSAPAQVRR